MMSLVIIYGRKSIPHGMQFLIYIIDHRKREAVMATNNN